MQTISDEYRKLNEQLHEENKHFGNNGAIYLEYVANLIKQTNSRDVLDFGCGKGALANNLPFPIKQYDPAIPKYSALPEPADLVVCTDVIEHIEPEFLDNVLTQIRDLTKKLCYMVISIEPAWKTLPDGRNAHLIVESYDWWWSKIRGYFHILNLQHFANRIGYVLAPLDYFDKRKAEKEQEKQVNQAKDNNDGY